MTALTTLMKHQIAVNVDSWAIVHLIMPMVIDDPEIWIACSSNRSEVPSEALGIITKGRYSFNRSFCLFLRSNDFSSSNDFVSYFGKISVQDSLILDGSSLHADTFRIPDHFISTGGTPVQFIEAAFVWYKFLNQKHFRPYWDDVEGVGVSVMRDFFPPYDLRLLDGFSVPLPDSIQQLVPPPMIRDSRTKDLYLGGPLSLVNHACSRHSNCVLNLKGAVRLSVDTFIMSGQRLYMCYNSDEDEMRRVRGFGCAICFRCFVMNLVKCVTEI